VTLPKSAKSADKVEGHTKWTWLKYFLGSLLISISVVFDHEKVIVPSIGIAIETT
jgi:hypothetical protein